MLGVGTQLKLNLHLTLPNGLKMSDVDFIITFYTYNNKRVVKSKNECVRRDDDNYVVIVDTTELRSGEIKYELCVTLPDNDTIDKVRKIIKKGKTCISVV